MNIFKKPLKPKKESASAPAAQELTAPKEGQDFYMENGFMVFTEAYHLKRGYCCGSGCRHCPYKVKPPK